MKILELQPSADTPYVRLDPYSQMGVIGSGTCESKPEDAYGFYKPIQQWITDYVYSGNSFTLVVDVRYYNTSSSRCLYAIFETLDEQYIHALDMGIENDQLLQIVWRCGTTPDTEDDDIENAEAWLLEGFKIPFRIEPYRIEL